MTDKLNCIIVDIARIRFVFKVEKINFFLAVKIKRLKNNSNKNRV